VIDQLVTLARQLGATEDDYAILAEGNVSAPIDEHRLHVKASGTSLRDATRDSFLEVRIDPMLALIDDPPESEAEQNEALAACANGNGTARPSIETPLHAVAVRYGRARVVAHTHPTAVNAILCSERAADLTRALFPDQVVVCGASPLLLPYTDPGLPLARALRDALLERGDRPPKTIYLRNHGLVALADTPQEALQITAMAVKAARVLQGALGAGGPVFLTDEQAAAIDARLDEHFRRDMLARHGA
jgi:rhamnose utilization protein RhaD (predicted bifunctional aldolase and dehydrogenase)